MENGRSRTATQIPRRARPRIDRPVCTLRNADPTRRLRHDRVVPVEAIHLGAPREPELWAVESVRAVAGKGLEGDRHFHAGGAPPGQALTLVAAEVVEEVGLRPGDTRRQVTVRDVDVNALVGK